MTATSITLSGFSSVATGISAAGASKTVTPSESGFPTQDVVAQAQTIVNNASCEGVAVNIAGAPNPVFRNFGWNCPRTAWINRTMQVAQTGSSGLTMLLGRSANSYFDQLSTWTSASIIGQTAELIQINSGSVVRHSTTVTAANIDFWPSAPFMYPQSSGSKLQINQAVSGPSVIIGLQSGWAINTQYWLGIYAVLSDGSSGPISYVSIGTVSAIPSNTTASVTNTLVSLTGNVGQVVAGSLAAPTGVTATESSPGSGVWTISCAAVSGAYGYRGVVSAKDPATFAPNDTLTLTFADLGGITMSAGTVGVHLVSTFTQPTKGMIHWRYGNSGDRGALFQRDGWARSGLVSWANEPSTPYLWNKFGAGDAAPSPELTWYMRRSYAAGQTGTTDTVTWLGTATDTFYYQTNATDVIGRQFWVRTSAPYTFTWRIFNVGPCTITYNGSTYSGTDVVVNATTSWQLISFTYQLQSALVSGAGGEQIVRTDTSSAISLDMCGHRTQIGSQTILDVPGPLKLQMANLGEHRWQTSVIDPTGMDLETMMLDSGDGPLGMTFSTNLQISQSLGITPNLMFQYFHPLSAVQDLVAYLCAPVSSGHPLALQRQVQGQMAPWINQFQAIRLSNSNEPWNLGSGYPGPVSLNDGVTGTVYTTGQVYGYWTKAQWDAMEASPYWSTKLQRYICAHIGDSYGDDAAAVVGTSRVYAIEPGRYINNYSTRAQNGQGWLTMAAGPIINDWPALKGNVDRATAAGVKSHVYELGQQIYTVSTADEELIKSMAAAVGMLDIFMQYCAYGGTGASFFQLGYGDGWATQAFSQTGGGIYPLWAVMQQLQTEFGTFKVLNVDLVKTVSLTLTASQILGSGGTVDKIAVYQIDSTTYPGRRGFVILNRDIDRSILPTSDPLYQAGYNVVSSILLLTNIKDVSAAKILDYCTGYTFMQSNRYSPGTDAYSVSINVNWQQVTLPNLQRINIGTDTPAVKGGPLILAFEGVAT